MALSLTSEANRRGQEYDVDGLMLYVSVLLESTDPILSLLEPRLGVRPRPSRLKRIVNRLDNLWFDLTWRWRE